MKHFIVILACLVIASCGGGGSGSEQTEAACSIIGLNTKIIGGEACSDLERASIVRIMALVEVDNDLYPVPVCTGTMVTSDTVLTAQHCLITDFAGYPVRDLGIYSGEPGSGNLIAASLYSRAPGYRFEPSVSRIFNDAALIKLSESSTLPSVPILLSRSVDIGETGYVYGYGATAENQDPNDVNFFDLEAGTMNIQNVTPDHIFVAFDGGSVNVCNGDSGGPLVVLVDGQPAIAGVVSQGSVEGCVSGDVTTFTNLQSQEVLNWLAAAVPEASVRSNIGNRTEIWTNDLADLKS